MYKGKENIITAEHLKNGEKCILLCDNCHRELHDNLWNIEELNKNIEERDS